jgi:UDPglucose 6-dehydrogenase
MYAVPKKRIHLTVYLSFNMKIIIAGYGFVGKAVAKALRTKHEVVIVDPKYTTDTIADNHDADGLIICVDTPTVDGLCNIENVANVMDTVPIFMPVLIKSTITPGILIELEELYTNHSIVYNPEFLRARTADQDFIDQKYCVLGGEDPEGFWQELFTSILPNCKLFFHCTAVEAATVKYGINAFLATKVAFFNQLYDMCEQNGADYKMVRQMITHDSRIGNSHTLVPGLDSERGFGGACLPKDTEAFIHYANTINAPFSILNESVKYNKKVRKNP